MGFVEEGLMVGGAHCALSYDDVVVRLQDKVEEGGGLGFLLFSGLASRRRLVGEVGSDVFRLTPSHKMGGASVTMIGVASQGRTNVRSVITWPALSFFWGMPTVLLFWMAPWYWAGAGSLVFALWAVFQAKVASGIGLRFLEEEAGITLVRD